MSLKLGLRNKIRRSRAGGFTGLLDQSFASGATAAYSLRKLKSSATKAVRVREDGSNSETDIGFSGGTLDTTALLNHVGSNNGFVTKWYDQSGNGNDASNSTASQQPQIVSSGSIIKENGRPALKFDGSDDVLLVNTPIDIDPGFTSFSVDSIDFSNDVGFAFGKETDDGYTPFQSGGIVFMYDRAGFAEATLTIVKQKLLTGYGANSNNREIYLNGSLLNTLNSGMATNNNFNSLGKANGNYAKANAQELIFYLGDNRSNQTKIEANIDNHYAIPNF